MPWQLSCPGICKIMAWLDNYFSHMSNNFFHKIWIMSPWTISETGLGNLTHPLWVNSGVTKPLSLLLNFLYGVVIFCVSFIIWHKEYHLIKFNRKFVSLKIGIVNSALTQVKSAIYIYEYCKTLRKKYRSLHKNCGTIDIFMNTCNNSCSGLSFYLSCK